MRSSVLLLAAWALFGQDRPVFEAASIKANTSGGMGMGMSGGGSQFAWTNTSLRQLVQTAYGVRDFEYSGPEWLDSARFDVVAKLPSGGGAHRADRYLEMLQSLLADRFKLAVHRETREMPGLALVVDKKGLRIRPVEGDGGGSSSGPNMVQGTTITMEQFADTLARSLNRPVKDRTGLTARYTIKIRWTPDMPGTTDPTDLPGSVYAAVQELGLRLQTQKVTVEILVVDRAERTPTEN